MSTTRYIAFGDIHDDLGLFDDILACEKMDGVIITGDITLGGGIKQAASIVSKVADKVPLVMAQIGNMDRAEITGWLEEKGWNIHARARELYPGIFLLGLGCSPFTPFGTPSEHPESRLAEWLHTAYNEALRLYSANNAKTASHNRDIETVYKKPRFILVSHTPPLHTACDRLHNGTCVGSSAVREFIEELQPDLCLCGHIHESAGEDYIGKTQIINPGTLSSGGYVVVTIEDGPTPQIHAERKQLAHS